VHQAENLLWSPEVAQPMNTEVGQFGMVREPIKD
jgi:hypothetical protein